MTGKIQIRLAVLAALAALTAVLVPSGLASGTHVSPHPNISDGPNVGVVQLTLNGTDEARYLEWDALADSGTGAYVDADPNVVQQIGPPVRCELSESGPLVALSAGSGGPVGQDGDDVGIRQGGPRGTPCGQVDAGEDPLVINLVGMQADYAELDIEGKHNVAVSVEAFLGETEVGSLQLAFNCEDDSDCGPDSADGDNFRVIIAMTGSYPLSAAAAGTTAEADIEVSSEFDTLKLYVTSAGGEFSLNGGADGTAPGPLGDFMHTTATLFHVTNVVTINCDDPTELLGSGVSGLFLKANCDGAIHAVFTTDPADDPEINEVSLANLGAGIAGAYSLELWTFNPIPAHSLNTTWPGTPDPADTRLWYNDGAGDLVAPYCLTDPRIVVAGSPTFALADGLDTTTILPSGHTTCIIVDQRTVVDGSAQGQFILFSTGDLTRGFR